MTTKKQMPGTALKETMFDFERVGVVLAAVAKAGEPAPKGLMPSCLVDSPLEVRARHERDVRDSRRELAQAISWAFTCRDIQADLASATKGRQRHEDLGKILRSAKTVINLIEGDSLLSINLARHFPSHLESRNDGCPDYCEMLSGIQKLVVACTEERLRMTRSGLDGEALLSAGQMPWKTPGGAFVTELGKVYKATFGSEPKVKLNAEWEATGPFIAFVQAVAETAGQTMNPEAIRRAWDRANPDKAPGNS